MDILVTVDHLAKSFGAHDIFDKVSFTIRQGEKLGLVGVNGSGKTTLLRCLMDPSFADKGTVQYAGEIRVGYVEQGFDNIEDETIWEFMLRSCPDILSLREKMKDLERESGEKTGEALKDVLDRYGRVEARYAHLDGYHYENNIKRVLIGLGYPESTWEHNALALSGGQKTRLQLAAALVNSPDLLVLDEPTNHLDIVMSQWLEKYLREFRGGVLIISHDRAFLDAVAEGILEMEGGPCTVIKETIPAMWSKKSSRSFPRPGPMKHSRKPSDARKIISDAIRRASKARWPGDASPSWTGWNASMRP